MLNTAIKSLERKWTLILIFGMLVFGRSAQLVYAQEVTHTYKIIGAKRIPSLVAYKVRLVEYDPNSSDHLFISILNSDGVLLEKAQFQFTGKRFNLSDYPDYLKNKQILLDGIYNTYLGDQSIENEKIYKNDTLRQQTVFYSAGKKHMTFNGDEETLNGEFIMWHPNGQISFLGNYKNNLKDGQFESFDLAGKTERKGTYREGKLIEGESVVQDFIYDAPEVNARFKDNDSIFNEILALKTAHLEEIKMLESGVERYWDLKFTIDKTGQINSVNIGGQVDPLDKEIIHSVFKKDFIGFTPAILEGVPVRSNLHKLFSISNKGLQTYSPLSAVGTDSTSTIYFIIEEMPEFPGGDTGLREFIAKNVRYPAEAVKKGAMGKIYVSFVILEDGKVGNIKIARGAQPLLNAEAIRVVQQMPKWKPGRHKGKPVKVGYTVPINFVLQGFKKN